MYLNDVEISPELFLSTLRQNGAASLPLLRPAVINRLAKAAQAGAFVRLPERVPPHNTRQQMEAWKIVNRQGPFWELADELDRFFGKLLGKPLLNDDILFNEVEVIRYWKGSIGIEPHLDSNRYINLICLVNLTGGGRFITCSDRVGANPKLHHSDAGDVVVMRGAMFPGPHGPLERPFHYVPPVWSERFVCSIRQTI